MNRRSALSYLAVALGGATVLPGCWTKEWTKESIPAHGLKISAREETLLAELVETLIPEGEQPGARSLGVDQYILTMVSDISDQQAQEEFVTGFNKFEEATKARFGKRFGDLDEVRRLEVLRTFLASEDPAEAEVKAFVSFVKGITVRGYMSSEYVMKNVLKYELIPGRFDGCFPVEKSLNPA
jgi:hypothetical protein